MNNNTDGNITIRNIDIPFGRLVVILLKLMLASIPAILLFYIILFVFVIGFMAVFGGGAALLQQLFLK